MKWVLRVIRAVFRIPPPRLSEADVLRIAEHECVRRGWPFAQPVVVQEGLRTFSVLTHADHRGGNVSFVIGAQTGEVVRAGFANR